MQGILKAPLNVRGEGVGLSIGSENRSPSRSLKKRIKEERAVDFPVDLERIPIKRPLEA